jgi:hypothetical protein
MIIGGIITSNRFRAIHDSGSAPDDGRESAIIAELQTGNYTAIVRGVNDPLVICLTRSRRVRGRDLDCSKDLASIP